MMKKTIIQRLIEDVNDWHHPLPDEIHMSEEYYTDFCKDIPNFYEGFFFYDGYNMKDFWKKPIAFCRVPIKINKDAFLGMCFVFNPKPKLEEKQSCGND